MPDIGYYSKAFWRAGYRAPGCEGFPGESSDGDCHQDGGPAPEQSSSHGWESGGVGIGIGPVSLEITS